MSVMAVERIRPPRAGAGSQRVYSFSSVAHLGTPALRVGPEVDHEREDHEQPLEPGHVVSGAPLPERHVAQRGPRQQEEAEHRHDPAVVGVTDVVGEDPEHEQDESGREQRKQREKTAHVTSVAASSDGDTAVALGALTLTFESLQKRSIPRGQPDCIMRFPALAGFSAGLVVAGLSAVTLTQLDNSSSGPL